jgi:hypothetical protein
MRTRNPGTGRKIGPSQQTGKARRIIHTQYARRVADGGRQSPRSLAVECVDHSFAEVVVIDAIAGSNGTLSMIAE